MTTMTPQASSTDLERKIDALTEQLAFVEAELREQRARRAQWDDLRADLAPVTREAMAIAARELEGLEEFVGSDDLLRLGLRLLRNARNIEQMVERLESGLDLLDDVAPLSREVFAKVLGALDAADRRGYFSFARAGADVVDRVVTNFSEEDVEQLADNVVLILETVKEMTQPEIMAVLYRMVAAIQKEQAALQAHTDETPSLLELLRKVRDPAVRRGLGRALSTLGAVSDVDVGPPRRFVANAERDHERDNEGDR